MAKQNFECMLCDNKSDMRSKGFHLGICKECVRRIKVSWPTGKDIAIVTDSKPIK